MNRNPIAPADVLRQVRAPRLPAAPESEAAFLGAILATRAADADEVRQVLGLVRPADFVTPQYRTVFEALLSLAMDSKPTDLLAVVNVLRAAGSLKAVGDSEALALLVDTVPSTTEARRYASEILEASRRRRAVEAASAFIKGGGNGDGQAEALREALDSLKETARKDHPGPRPVPAILAEAVGLEDLERIPSSIAGLNEIIGGGFAPSWFVLYPGYTAAGKTSILLAESIGAASKGYPVLHVTLELGAIEVARRVAAVYAPVPVAADLPLLVLEQAHELGRLVDWIEKWTEGLDAGKPPVVAVDYAQRVIVPGEQSRERQVARVGEELQALGRRRGILLLVGAQLNRESVKGEGGPAIHQVRESGLLEQVADVILLLEKTGPDRLRVRVGKNRWGASGGDLELGADFGRCQFGPLTPAQRYGELGRAVVEYLQDHGGKAKVRDISQGVRFSGSRPKRVDILAAEQAVGGFRVIGSEANLC